MTKEINPDLDPMETVINWDHDAKQIHVWSNHPPTMRILKLVAKLPGVKVNEKLCHKGDTRFAAHDITVPAKYMRLPKYLFLPKYRGGSTSDDESYQDNQVA